jgi:hypothetical protein
MPDVRRLGCIATGTGRERFSLRVGQQQAQADQGRKRDGKPHGSLSKRRGDGRMSGRGDFGRRHDNTFGECKWFWRWADAVVIEPALGPRDMADLRADVCYCRPYSRPDAADPLVESSIARGSGC